MFLELNSALNWDDSGLQTGSVFLVKDCLEADGGFLLQHFLSSTLKAHRSCVLISYGQSLSHYAHIQKKLASFDADFGFLVPVLKLISREIASRWILNRQA